MSKARWLSCAAVALCVLLGPATAQAVYQCDGETDDCPCNASDPYPCCDNGGGNFGNCTWWAWEAACCDWAYGLPGWGNAKEWAGNAQAHPDFQVLSSPVVGSIGCRDVGTWGHVAWVTGVAGSTVTVTEMNCCAGCNNGVRSWSYDASYFTGGYIVRVNQCECSVGDSQNQSCGNCGQQSRSCGSDCMWNGWEACTGEGPCADGQTETQDCGDCGQQTRACQPDCSWASWGLCAGPDPGGGAEPCDTGQPGACASGVQRCVDGLLTCEPEVASQPELCNGLDDDCDELVDEDGVCDPDAGPPPDGGGGSSATTGPGGAAGAGALAAGGEGMTQAPGVVGECTCRAAPAGRLGWPQALWLSLIALALGRRRRPSSSRRGTQVRV